MDNDKKLSESLKKYAEIIKELQDAQGKIPNNGENLEICRFLHESFLSWSAHEGENVRSIDEDLRIPFSYSHKEMGILKEILKERESIYNNYRKTEAKQKPDKSRDALERAKEMYGYANYKAQREVERVLLDETDLAILHFTMAAKRQAERIAKFHMIWGGLMQKLSEMKFELDSTNKTS